MQTILCSPVDVLAFDVGGAIDVSISSKRKAGVTCRRPCKRRRKVAVTDGGDSGFTPVYSKVPHNVNQFCSAIVGSNVADAGSTSLVASTVSIDLAVAETLAPSIVSFLSTASPMGALIPDIAMSADAPPIITSYPDVVLDNWRLPDNILPTVAASVWSAASEHESVLSVFNLPAGMVPCKDP